MLPICYFQWMLTLLYLTCLSMYLRRVITDDAVVCRRGQLHPMSYNISHHLCNCSLTSTIYWLPVGTHVSGTDPRFDPEEQLASAATDFGWVLAKMKCPINYLSGLTKYVLTSSILPIPVAINGYVLYSRCIKHVLVNMSNTFCQFPYLFIDIWAILCSGSTCPVMFNSANCILSVPVSMAIKPVAINSCILYRL